MVLRKGLTRPRLVASVVFLLALHALASLWSASRESATWDEPGHIGAGYAHVGLYGTDRSHRTSGRLIARH